MKKYKIYFRINEYLMINDYEEIKGDLDSRVIAGKDEDDAISKLRKSLERYMKGTETRIYQWEMTTTMTDPNTSTLRGWFMDELEKRFPDQFDKWLDSDCRDEDLRKFIYA